MSKIIQTGSCLGNEVYSNEEFIQKFELDSTDEWIKSRTGIESRYLAENMTVEDLSVSAANVILNEIGDEIKDNISTVIVATMSSHSPTPSVAGEVIRRLEIPNAYGFDLNGACSGFVMAVELANHIAQLQKATYTLVVGAEKMSSILDFSDRSTSVLFGDGAGAVLIENTGSSLPDYQSQLKNIGDYDQALTYYKDQYFQMKGRDVFNFVKRIVIPALKNFIEEHSLRPDIYVCHQANERLIDLIGQKLGEAKESLPVNVNQVANTSAASIPLLLDQLVKNKKIELNQSKKIILSGFGGGLSYGHTYFRI